jgi:hypothetical protein
MANGKAGILMVKGVKTRDKALRSQAAKAFAEEVATTHKMESQAGFIFLMAFAIENDETLRNGMGAVIAMTQMLLNLPVSPGRLLKDLPDFDRYLGKVSAKPLEQLSPADFVEMANGLRRISIGNDMIRMLFGDDIFQKIAAEKPSAATLMAQGVRTRNNALRRQAANAFKQELMTTVKIDRAAGLCFLMAFAVENDRTLRDWMGAVIAITKMLSNFKDLPDFDRNLGRVSAKSQDQLTHADLDEMAAGIRRSVGDTEFRGMFGKDIFAKIAAEK